MSNKGHILGFLPQKQCSHCWRYRWCLEFNFPSYHSSICNYLMLSSIFQQRFRMVSHAPHLPSPPVPPDITLPPCGRSDSPASCRAACRKHCLVDKSHPALLHASSPSPTESALSILKTKPNKIKPNCCLLRIIKRQEQPEGPSTDDKAKCGLSKRWNSIQPWKGTEC